MSELTFDAVEAKVRELAAERPNFRYLVHEAETCKYNPNDDQPGCIFGQALIALGHPVPLVYDSVENAGNNAIAAVLRDYFDLHLSCKEAEWASSVQGDQDGGTPWGEAVRRADSLASRYQ